MQRVPKDPNIKSSGQISPKIQTYRNLNPPRQNLDPQKSTTPFHLYSSTTPYTQSESQFLSPQSASTKKQQNYRYESLSPQNQSKLTGLYSKNSPIHDEPKLQKQLNQRLYPKQLQRQSRHYPPDKHAKKIEPTRFEQDKNQRPQSSSARNNLESDSHRRANSHFMNYNSNAYSSDKSPLNSIMDRYRNDIRNIKYVPINLQERSPQLYESNNPGSNRIEFRYAQPRQTPRQVSPRYNQIENQKFRSSPYQQNDIYKEKVLTNYENKIDRPWQSKDKLENYPSNNIYQNSPSISKQSSPIIPQSISVLTSKDQFDSQRSSGTWDFLKTIGNSKPTSVKEPDIKASESSGTPKISEMNNFIKSVSSSKPVSPAFSEAQQLIKRLKLQKQKVEKSNEAIPKTNIDIGQKEKDQKHERIQNIFQMKNEAKVNRGKNILEDNKKSDIGSQIAKSDLSPEAQQKIKVLSEHVNDLRDKLKNFHKSYGKPPKDEQKEKEDEDASFQNSSVHSQKIRKLEKQFHSKLMKNVKQLEEKMANKARLEEKLQKDLKIQGAKIKDLVAEKQKLQRQIHKYKVKQSEIKYDNEQITKQNQGLKKEIASLKQAAASKQSEYNHQENIVAILREELISKNHQIGDLWEQVELIQREKEEVQDKLGKTEQKIKLINENSLKKIEEIEMEYRIALTKSQEQIKCLKASKNNIENEVKMRLMSLLLIVKSMHSEKVIKENFGVVSDRNNENWVKIAQKIQVELLKLHEIYSQKDTHMIKLQKELIKQQKNQQFQQKYKQTLKKEAPKKKSEIKGKKNIERIKNLQQSIEILEMQFSRELESMRSTVSEKKSIEEENKNLQKKLKELVVLTEDPLQTNENKENSSLGAFSGVKESKIENEDTFSKDNMQNQQRNNFEEETIIKIKSLKQIDRIATEAILRNSKDNEVTIPKSILIYICDTLQIPLFRQEYIQFVSQPLKKSSRQLQSDEKNHIEQRKTQSGQILLENIINYLQNNSYAFIIQKLYIEILELFERDIQFGVEFENTHKIASLLIAHKSLLKILQKEQRKLKRLSELEGELEVACQQIEDVREERNKEKMESARLQQMCNRLSQRNEEMCRIVCEQNEQIVRYHIKLQNMKLEKSNDINRLPM